jgi:DNA-binding GntR family transcriptional regulator
MSSTCQLVWCRKHSAAVDIARMRVALAAMQQAVDAGDATEFVRSNWELHAAIAEVSPRGLLRSLYLSLLELIGSHYFRRAR